MKRIAIILSALVLVLALGIPTFAMAAGNGSIQGSLVNKTAGTKSAVDNQQITLTTYVSGAPTGDATAKTDAQGKFSFTGLVTDPGTSYQITFEYQSVHYATDEISFAPGEITKTAEVPVYDTTNDASLISLGVVHTLMSPQPGSLVIIQIYPFQNSSDRAYVGAPGSTPVVSISMPANATNVQLLGGLSDATVNTADGLSDPSSILPGERDVVIQYEVPPSGTFSLSQKLTVLTQQYNLLVEGTNVNIANSQLTKGSPVPFNGKNYTSFTSTSDTIPAGTTITGTLTFPAAGMDNSSSSTGTGTSSNPLVLYVIIGAVVLGGALAFTLMLRKKHAPVTAGTAAGPDDALLAEIAALDDEFESGNISKESYNEQRAEKKAQLLELLQGTRGASSKEQ